jgi:ribose-phosphate pyrophosphokinase
MNLQLFALNATRELGQRIAECLHMPLANHEEREFEDGEHKARPLESVRGRDVYIVHSLYGDREQTANDKLVRLLFFAGALKDAGAQRVTAVVPYLCYARKDRRTKPRDPVTSRYVAGLFESVGVDRVVTLDVHNLAAYENAFRIRAEHLEARPLLVDYVATHLGSERIAVVSPDVGGVKRAEAFREALEERLGRRLERAFMEKKRSEGVVSGDLLVGRVAGCDVVIVDDLVSSGTTLRRAVNACRVNGAGRICAAVTHGLFTTKAADLFGDPALESLVVADTVPPFRLGREVVQGKLRVIDSAPLIAEAIRRLHTNGSLTELAHGVREPGHIQEAKWALS